MSQQPAIIVSTRDLAKLESLLEKMPAMTPGLKELEDELSRAEVVPPHLVPDDVVTMNSTVSFQLAGADEPFTLTLVYPDEMINTPERISILAPVGSALLGLRKGDSILWPGPDSKSLQVTIVDVIAQSH